MAGRILYVPPPPYVSHVCNPPVDSEFAAPILPGKDPADRAPVGTVWQCDCGLTWVVRRGNRMSSGFDYWGREKRRERRQRERRA